MYISCCAPIGQCHAVAEAGFDRVVLSAQEVAGAPLNELRKLERSFALWALECRALNDFCSPELKLCGPNYHREGLEHYMRRLAPRAAGLGITQLGVGAPLSRSIPADYPQELAWEQLGRSLDLIAQLCRPWGIEVLLEPICRQMTNLLNRTQEVLALVERCEEPVGVVYDIFHAWMMKEPPADALPAMDRIGVVHIAHAQEGRRLPTAETVIGYQPYFDMLLEAGYQGELSVEAQLDWTDRGQLAQSCRALRQMVTPCSAAG